MLDSLSSRMAEKLMDLTWDCAARAKDESEEIDSDGTTEIGAAAQGMICGGAMIQ